MVDYNFDTLKLPYSKTEWYDADQRMFDACFTILGQFVIGELGEADMNLIMKSNIKDDDTIYHGYIVRNGRGFNQKAIDLWIWYIDYLPKLEKDCNRDYGRNHIVINSSYFSDGDFSSNIKYPLNRKYTYKEIECIKTEKLNQLMEIRGSLWT